MESNIVLKKNLVEGDHIYYPTEFELDDTGLDFVKSSKTKKVTEYIFKGIYDGRYAKAVLLENVETGKIIKDYESVKDRYFYSKEEAQNHMEKEYKKIAKKLTRRLQKEIKKLQERLENLENA